MYLNIYVYSHKHVYITFMYISIHYLYTYVHFRDLYMYLYIYISTQMYAFKHIYVYTHTHTYIYWYITCIHMCTFVTQLRSKHVEHGAKERVRQTGTILFRGQFHFEYTPSFLIQMSLFACVNGSLFICNISLVANTYHLLKKAFYFSLHHDVWCVCVCV